MNIDNMSGNLTQVFDSFNVMPVFEFAAAVFVVMIAYLGIHSLFSRWHQLVKFSLAVFVGSLGYSFGKIVLIALFIQPFFGGPTANGSGLF